MTCRLRRTLMCPHRAVNRTLPGAHGFVILVVKKRSLSIVQCALHYYTSMVSFVWGLTTLVRYIKICAIFGRTLTVIETIITSSRGRKKFNRCQEFLTLMISSSWGKRPTHASKLLAKWLQTVMVNMLQNASLGKKFWTCMFKAFTRIKYWTMWTRMVKFSLIELVIRYLLLLSFIF